MRPRYVFTWAGTEGPERRFFDDAGHLLAWASGWQNAHPAGYVLLIASPYEVRA